MTLGDWVASTGCRRESDLLPQMDIKGCKYESLFGTTDSLISRFRVIVVEFHSFDMPFSKPFPSIAASAFEKTLKGYTCVHAHPNNCCGSLDMHGLVIPHVMEFTILRNDRVVNAPFASTFPQPLDSDNTAMPPLCCLLAGSDDRAKDATRRPDKPRLG